MEDDLDATVQRTHDLITDAAQRQLVSDVPLACFLSGGLDSSILSAVAARAYAARNETLHTWSVDYRENQRYFVKNSFQPTDDRDFAALDDGFSRHASSPRRTRPGGGLRCAPPCRRGTRTARHGGR
ncbi:MAG: asparagine synthase-related protein [Butyricicoccaceae bacterium]